MRPWCSLGLALITLFGQGTTAEAMAPMTRPVADATIPLGQSQPYIGSWSVTLYSREAAQPELPLAICTLPVRIEEANDTHIFYLGPRDVEADAATELIAQDDGTAWEPIAGGPAFFAIWVTQDSFYLYDAVSEGEPDWATPFVYKRCG